MSLFLIWTTIWGGGGGGGLAKKRRGGWVYTPNAHYVRQRYTKNLPESEMKIVKFSNVSNSKSQNRTLHWNPSSCYIPSVA